MSHAGSGSAVGHRVPVLLSVCIPVFNHAALLHSQFDALGRETFDRNRVEFVIVDDGSTDQIDPVVESVRSAGWRLVFARQAVNGGRAGALARALRMASGQFAMVMDADDEFLPGAMNGVLSDLQRLMANEDPVFPQVAGLVYGTVLVKEGRARENLPPADVVCSPLALRADHSVKGDLKEVVATRVLTSALCPLFDDFRRVPTSLLWARISDGHAFLCQARPVVRKVYLPGGMTKSIHSYRKNSLVPLLALYRTIARSRAYESLAFRLRAVINYHRFLAWDRHSKHPWMSGWFGLVGLFGYAGGRAERWLRR